MLRSYGTPLHPSLGPLAVTLDGQTITSLAYDKVWALLAYLVHTPHHPHRRESLAGLLWPDQPEEKARHNLRQALARLRQAIGDTHTTPPFLLIDRSSITVQYSQRLHTGCK